MSEQIETQTMQSYIKYFRDVSDSLNKAQILGDSEQYTRILNTVVNDMLSLAGIELMPEEDEEQPTSLILSSNIIQ